MHHLRIDLCKSLLIIILANFILVFIASSPGQSQGLNLNGLVEINYNTTATTSKSGVDERKSTTSNILQRYSISSSGVIVDPRLASYSAGIGISDSVYSSKPYTGESTEVRRDTLTYSLQMGLLPTRIPVNLFAQKNVMNAEERVQTIRK